MTPEQIARDVVIPDMEQVGILQGSYLEILKALKDLVRTWEEADTSILLDAEKVIKKACKLK